MEFLPGSWIFIPSALLTHFNVDSASEFSSQILTAPPISISHNFPTALLKKLRIVKAQRGQQPTPASEPFRGTVAFFNPASFFAVSGTPYYTIKQAKEAGDARLLCTDFGQLSQIFPTA